VTTDDPRFTHTRVIPTFYSESGFDGEVVNGAHPEFGKVSGFTYQKQFGQASARWSLTFKHAEIDPLLMWPDPEDVWTRLDVLLGSKRYPLTLGLTDTLQKNLTRTGGGARDVTYTLTGRDIGKTLEGLELYINIYEQTGALPMIPLYTAVQDDLFGSPRDILTAILNAWLGNNGVADKQWRLPPGLGGGEQFFFDRLRLTFGHTRGRLYEPGLYNPDNFMGRKLWDTLVEFQNPLLNELWCDYVAAERNTGPGQPEPDVLPAPSLFLRERMFPTFEGGRRRWDSLATWDVTAADTRAANITKGNPQERFNFWMIEGQGLGGEAYETIAYIQEASARSRGEPGSVPIYNLESIRQHGMRRWQQSTRYLPFADESEWLLQAAPLLQITHDWYVTSHRQLSGTISTTRMMPWIRVGDRIKLFDRAGNKTIFYCEGVSHQYSYPNAGASTFTVTRGEEEGTDTLSVYYATVVSAQTEENDRARIEERRRLLGRLLEEGTFLFGPPDDATHGTPPDVVESSLDAETETLDTLDATDPALADDATLGETAAADAPLGREVDPSTDALVNPDAETVVAETEAGEFGESRLERGDEIPTETETGDVREPSGEPLGDSSRIGLGGVTRTTRRGGRR
jgi:hypothetical protein